MLQFSCADVSDHGEKEKELIKVKAITVDVYEISGDGYVSIVTLVNK